MMQKPKKKPSGKTLKRILSYMKAYRSKMLLVVVAILFSAAANVAGTFFLKPLLNDYILPLVGQKNANLSGFIGMLAMMAVIYGIGALCTFLYNRLMVSISAGTLDFIRKDLFTHMEKLSISFFDAHTHGELMSRFTNDTDTLREMISRGIPQLINSFITVLGIFVMMLVLSPILTLLVIITLVLMFAIAKKIAGKSARYFREQQQNLGAVNGYIEEMIEGQKVIKVFNHETAAMKDFDAFNESLNHASARAHTFANIMMPIMNNLSYFLYALVAGVGAALSIGGLLDLGTIAAFLQYSRSFVGPVAQISQQANSIFMALAGADRIFRLLDTPAEENEGTISLSRIRKNQDGSIAECQERTGHWAWKASGKNGTEYTPLAGDVVFKNVSFSYDGKKNVLNDISLFARPGQKIAFVGSTGAGKTTITNLINRFYDLSQGTIFYDGIDIRKINKNDLRRSLAIVLQDTHLFTGTVADNIRFGRLNATQDEIVNAAKLANAHAFIQHLPQGYETMLTADGANLSQGQRQLLSIARAAVADPPVLILDEATSSIDTRTESFIEKGMDQLMHGRTVFVIAHRLSTIRNADAILVLEQGKIIERGNHQELLAQKGRYYQLYTGAFELS